MTNRKPADQAQRDAALQLDGSFIVQAPAGSGKTELLSQRMLKLLARVDRPERVLAITFTRKATQEMRNRMLRRLRQAEAGEAVEPHERTAVALAQGVLDNGRQQGWNLLENPGRLRILTIDALCTQLLQRSPQHGASVGGLRIMEDARPLHRKAARALIEDLGGPPSAGDPEAALAQGHDLLIRVLKHLEGDNQRLESLLVGMLIIRDQWMPLAGEARASMQELLTARQVAELANWREALGTDSLAAAEELLGVIGNGISDPEHAAARFAAYPNTSKSAEEAVWRAYWFCHAFRTPSGSPRGRTAIKPGIFPGLDPDRFESVTRLAEIYQSWFGSDDSRKALEWMAKSPPLEENPVAGELLGDVLALLQILLAELQVLIGETGDADFTHIAQAALEALQTSDGEEISPVLLAEDVRLEHLLVDEFQDTSHTQHRLVRLLTEGWVPGDGRTLFLVGDPMQSIYRFREADVGLFTGVVAHGRIGAIPVQPLALTANFRSRCEVVDWVNAQFPAIFPARDRIDSGAVSYHAATAELGGGGAVHVHLQPPDETPIDEAQYIVRVIRDYQAAGGDPTIALLTRNRLHLRAIIRELLRVGIPFDAVEMDPLEKRPAVQDLLAITRALEQPADRVAWLALLRGPWCALTVRQLHLVAGTDRHADFLQLMEHALAAGLLEPEVAERLAHLRRVMQSAMALGSSLTLAERVEQVWLQLGGLRCVSGLEDLENAELVLDLLRRTEAESPVEILPRVQDALEHLHARGRHAAVQLMTIHKAKGLEFDVVILPALGNRGGSGRERLVLAQQFSVERGDSPAGGRAREDGVLLAPLKAAGQKGPSLAGYLRRVDSERARFEAMRTLYVATTRAKSHLHLIGQLSESQLEKGAPPSGSFLEMLFPAFADVVALQQGKARATVLRAVQAELPPALPLLRLKSLPSEIFKAPVPGDTIAQPNLPARDSTALGSALHQWLELIHDHWDPAWSADWFEQRPEMLGSLLRRAGAGAASIPALLPRLTKMIGQIFQSAEAISLLSPEGKSQSFAELALVEASGQTVNRYVIDRLFQSPNGEWTIVDYKTGGDTEETRRQWQVQLTRYRSLVNALDSGAVSGTLVHQTSDNTIIDLSRETAAAEKGDGS